MSGPTFGSIGTLLGASTNAPAFAVPASVAAGDIIVVAFFVDTTSTTVTGMPTDFAHAEGSPRTVAAGGGFGEHSLNVCWKRASAGDTGTYTFNLSATQFVYGQAVRYPGAVGSGDPWDDAVAADGGAVNISTAPPVSVTTLGPDRLLIYVATDGNGDSGTWSPPAGYTQRSSGAPNITNVEISDLPKATAGSSGSVSATTTAAGYMGAWIGALIGTTGGAAEQNTAPSTLPPPLLLELVGRQQRMYDTRAGTQPTVEGGSTLIALAAGPATAVKVAQASGRVGLALAGGGTARKTATAAGTSELAQLGAATAVKVTPAAGRAVVALTGVGSTSATRPQTGTGRLAVLGTAAEAKIAAVAGRAVIALTGAGAESSSTTRAQAGSARLLITGVGAAGKSAACAGRTTVVLTGAGTSRKTAIPAGRSAAALAGGSTARKTALTAGRDALALTGVGAAPKRALPAGRSELALVGAGTVSPTGARPQTGRATLALTAYMAHQCTTTRPFTGTTTHVVTLTTRPDTGITEVPC